MALRRPRQYPDKTTGASAIEEYNLSSYDNSSVSWGRTATDSLIPDRDRKYIAGQFVWTGFDYIGEPSPFGSKGGSSQSGPKSSFFGAVDTAGFAKDNYYLYQSQWLDRKSDPMVHILPHWNWEDEDLRELVTVDGKIPVRVYSNASAVELFVNGVSQGKKEFARMETDYGVSYQQQSEDSDRLYLEWPLTWNYAVGTSIEAVAYDESGAEIARDQMVTAGEPAGLSAESDRSVISADGYDLAYITIDVQDANGNFMPTADNEIYFHISGDGEIVGVDNGDAASWERYQDYDGVWKRKAYSGKALVIVKSTKEEGSFTVTASSPGLNQDSVTVYTKDSQSSQEGILGYETPSIAVDVGTKPEDVILPEKVNAIRADGSEMEVQVIWNPLSEESLLSAGEFEIEGKTQDGAAVKAVVSVRGPVGIREITVGVVKENLPVMPGEAELVWSDGKTQSVDVDWEEITPEQTVKAGTFEVKGKVAGYEEFEAIAHIVVVDSATEQNVALANAGSSVSVSYEEGSHKASHLIDGITDNEDNGWGNWQKEGRFEDWATVNFPQEYTVSKAVLRLSDTNTWQLPDRVLISYLDEETGEYQTVKNQSLITGFVGGINANTITFDPVTTDKLRFTFYIDGNAYDSGKDMIKVNEIEVYADILPLEKEAELAELSVNGESIQEFEPGRYHYVYSLGYSEKVPEISAKAGDGATVFIRQAMSGSGSAFVEVTSQDGQTTNTYTVQFSRKSPALIQVLFENLPETVTEDDITELFVKGMMEDGKTIDGSSASVTYEVADGEDGGHAQIRDGKLYAYDSGTVTITATMTYKGTSCKAEPVSVEILENTAQKEVQSFEKVHVRAKKGIIPDLPAKITVYYNTGLPRSLDVTWDPVGEEIYASEGRFQVSGTVEGITQRPVAVIDMVDIVAAQNLSMAVAEGYEPELPDATTVYYSDGVTEEAQVEWEKVPVNGVYTGYVKDTDVPVACRVRIAEDTEKSVNYVIKYNGWGLPDGLASYTNDQVVNDKSSDSATHINDGYVEFSNGSEKRIWCNYVPSTLDPDKVQRSEDWVAAPIAVSGKIQEKTVDQVSFAVIDEESGSTKTIKVPKAYYVEYYVGPDYSQMLMEHYTTAGITYGGHMENETYWPDNPLMNEENWKEVTYVSKAELPSGKNGDWKKMLNVTFQPVKTSLVRIRMEAYEDYCLGVDELEVYGTEAKEESGIEGADVFVDGESCISEFANHSLTISTVPGEDFPKITASAKNNAAVTVIPATDFNPTATVLFVPEDGNEVHTERYTITFVQDALSYEELQEKLQAALEQIGQLEQRLSAKEKELEAALMEQNRLTEELNREHDNVTSLTERLETMQSQLAALQLSGSANEEEIRNLTSQITQLQTQLADAKTKEADLTQRLTEMEGEILLLQEERDLLKENVSRAEQAASSAKEALEKAQQEAESAKQEADKLREEADQAKTEKEQADKETAAAQAALKNAQEELQKLSEELQSLKAEQKNGQLPKEGDIFTVKGVKYRITDETKKQAEAYKAADKNAKTVRVPATVKIEGNAYKVTAVADSAFAKMKNLRKIVIGNQVTKIGRKAFFGDRKLKSIQIKSRKLKRVGAQALKNIFSKAVVKVPKGKKKAYTKLVKGKGQRKTVLIK